MYPFVAVSPIEFSETYLQESVCIGRVVTKVAALSPLSTVRFISRHALDWADCCRCSLNFP